MLRKENIEGRLIKKSRHLMLLLLVFTSFYACQTEQKKTIEQSPTNHFETPARTEDTTFENIPQINNDNFVKPYANSGIFTDNRDGQSYQWVRLKDGKKWMAQNLNHKILGTWCYDDELANCQKNGRLYTWQAANSACPKGWRLPTDEEWWAMTSPYGKAYNSYSGQEKMEGKDDGEQAYKVLMKGGSTGFNALLGGSFSATEGFDYLDKLGCYWTSSPNNNSNALGYYFYIHSRGLTRDSYSKESGFSCRCIQE